MTSHAGEASGRSSPWAELAARHNELKAARAGQVEQARALLPRTSEGEDVGILGEAAHLGVDLARAGVRASARNAATRGGYSSAVAVRDRSALAGRVVTPAAERPANPADGAHALSIMSDFYQHYDYWPCQEYTDLLAAWSLQCHATEDDGSPIWRALARLVIAAMHGCGKSGTLDNIAAMTGAIIPVDVTYAGIRDAISQHHKPVILDDAQIVFGAGKAAERVRKIINAHTKGRIGLNAGGEVALYVQMAMAGLPGLLAGKVGKHIEDTVSRCFIVWKERKPKGLHIPELSDAAQAQARQKMIPTMRDWCHTYRETLRGRAAEFGEGAPTGLPDLGGGGRGNDQLARSLLTVCDVATALVPEAVREADRSGLWDWSTRIRRALIFVSGVPEPAPEDESPLDSAAAAFADMWARDDASSTDDTEPGDDE